jgi:hypothetical protein
MEKIFSSGGTGTLLVGTMAIHPFFQNSEETLGGCQYHHHTALSPHNHCHHYYHCHYHHHCHRKFQKTTFENPPETAVGGTSMGLPKKKNTPSQAAGFVVVVQFKEEG